MQSSSTISSLEEKDQNEKEVVQEQLESTDSLEKPSASSSKTANKGRKGNKERKGRRGKRPQKAKPFEETVEEEELTEEEFLKKKEEILRKAVLAETQFDVLSQKLKENKMKEAKEYKETVHRGECPIFQTEKEKADVKLERNNNLHRAFFELKKAQIKDEFEAEIAIMENVLEDNYIQQKQKFSEFFEKIIEEKKKREHEVGVIMAALLTLPPLPNEITDAPNFSNWRDVTCEEGENADQTSIDCENESDKSQASSSSSSVILTPPTDCAAKNCEGQSRNVEVHIKETTSSFLNPKGLVVDPNFEALHSLIFSTSANDDEICAEVSRPSSSLPTSDIPIAKNSSLTASVTEPPRSSPSSRIIENSSAEMADNQLKELGSANVSPGKPVEMSNIEVIELSDDEEDGARKQNGEPVKKSNDEIVLSSDDEEENGDQKNNSRNEKVDQEFAVHLPNHDYRDLKIGRKHLRTLKNGYLLHDDTIDFVIRHHANKLLNDEQKNSVYIGICQFFQKLMTSGTRKMMFYEEEIEESDKKVLKENCDSIQSWTKNILSKKLLVFPVNVDVDCVVCKKEHWILAVVFNPAGAIVTPESNSDPCYVMVFNSLKLVQESECHVKHIVDTWLESVVKKEMPEAMFSRERVILSTPQKVPKQQNEYDCGAFVCHFAERVLKNFWHFKTKNMPISWDKIKRTNPPSNLRKEMFEDIMENCDDPETKNVVNRYYDEFLAKN